jgi:hypothetical protein
MGRRYSLRGTQQSSDQDDATIWLTRLARGKS